jgi:hypothetical protein
MDPSEVGEPALAGSITGVRCQPLQAREQDELDVAEPEWPKGCGHQSLPAQGHAPEQEAWAVAWLECVHTTCQGLAKTSIEAVADATEEAALNALFQADTVTGRYGDTLSALPIDRVLEHLRRSIAIGARARTNNRESRDRQVARLPGCRGIRDL